MRYLSALEVLVVATQRRAGSLLVLPLIALSACQSTAPTPATPAVAIAPADVSGTVTAAVQATMQAQSPGSARTSTPAPSIVVDEAFTKLPQGWPSAPQGPARYADGVYQLAPQVSGQFVAIAAPLAGPVRDISVSGRFHKSGGPAAGGYGLMINDQGPELHDGVNQGGRFVVLEVGDDGTVGVWQRDQGRWIDLLPWTPNAAVHTGAAPNDLTVRAQGKQITFLVNGTQVAQLASELVDGRVGVFVGGDGNQVVLDRFAVLSLASGTAGASWPPQPTATPNSVELLGRLDTVWSRGDWPQAFALLDQLERVDPAALDFQDKRYAAHMAAGHDLLVRGTKEAALAEFVQAAALDRNRGEANAALLALTPTPLATATSVSQTTRAAPTTSVVIARSHPTSSSALTCNPPGLGCGAISSTTGLPRTQYVSGYTRKDGTYVRPYYRSR